MLNMLNRVLRSKNNFSVDNFGVLYCGIVIIVFCLLIMWNIMLVVIVEMIIVCIEIRV